ncbi:hypothetical protein IMZ48_07715 [Candidatus Bathyarchaeota archaeon]|nr:hypothetical protein [Candidatus Bathyarchaeota archaeon]
MTRLLPSVQAATSNPGINSQTPAYSLSGQANVDTNAFTLSHLLVKIRLVIPEAWVERLDDKAYLAPLDAMTVWSIFRLLIARGYRHDAGRDIFRNIPVG